MNYDNLCPRCMREMKENRNGICPFCGYDCRGQAELTHQLKTFTILSGKYLVGCVIGEGGFGITYIGYDLNLEIRIAIKEFYPNGFCRRESAVTNQITSYGGEKEKTFSKWRENFVREAKNLAKCSNLPGIVDVKDFFEENNTAYIVMEYLEGKTLKDYVRGQGGKLPVRQVLAALEPIMLSLIQVHHAGLIHRDISPDNIMLTAEGTMKLLDFGAAVDFTKEEEKSLSIMLKPGYAPEEQYRTKGKQGPWTDVYALAATIYKCITGITPPEAMERLRKEKLTVPREAGAAINPTVEAALLKGMSVYAEDRYQTMEAFHQALFSQTAAPVFNQKQEVRHAQNGQKKRFGNGVAAAACVVAVVLFFLLILAVLPEKQERENHVVQTPQEKAADTVEEEQAVTEKEQREEGAEFAEEPTVEKEVSTYSYEVFMGDVDWQEAYEDCIARGGHLVTIESREEYEILLKQLTEQGMEKYLFWIGGMRLLESREYHWIDEAGNPTDTVLNDSEEYRDYWLEGEPSYEGEGIEEQFMMMIYITDLETWVWNDVPKNLLEIAPFYEGRIAYICEFEI